MAIAPVPTVAAPVLPPPGQINVRVATQGYHSAVVDSKVTPLQSIIVGIEGSNYTVDYYSQVLGSDNLLKPFEPTQLASYQQYYWIKQYQLKLQGSLGPADDTPTNVMSYKGSAILYPGLIPNIGDVIVGDIGDGYSGQFSVTNVEQATFFEQSTWKIDFEVVRYMTQDIMDNLTSKVVREGTFVANNLVYGQNPIVADATLTQKATLTSLIQSLGAQWFADFNSQEYKTQLVGGQTQSTYDPFLMRGILRVFDVTDFPQLRRIKILNISDFELTEYYDFWTMLTEVDGSQLPRCFVTAFAAPTERFNWQPYLDSIRYSGVELCVVPGELNNTADSELGIYTEPYGWMYDTPVASVMTDPSLTLPALGLDNSYVLSTGFWQGTVAGLSTFEYMVRGFLNGEAVDPTLLAGFCRAAPSWSRYERFYYVPILLIILKTTLLSPI